jgi:hypothetical protein
LTASRVLLAVAGLACSPGRARFCVLLDIYQLIFLPLQVWLLPAPEESLPA